MGKRVNKKKKKGTYTECKEVVDSKTETKHNPKRKGRTFHIIDRVCV